ncbi:MAG: tetratricopeptide repeat protein [Nitrosopumilaceae archaeon]
MWISTIVFVFGILIGLAFLAPENSFAIYNSEAVWELVIISSKPACSGYHYYMMEKYHDITEKYLELYNFENKDYPPQCMTELQYKTEYEKPHDLDLLILVYDRDLGRAELHSQNTGGLYMHQGDDLSQNHTIIFCDCPNFEYSDPVWILSHELSHFVLAYLGFDLDIVENKIHDLDQKFDICVESSYDDLCALVKTSVETDRSSWVVMAPYKPAIGKAIPSPSSDKAAFDSVFQKEMAIEITNWWLKGDITNENYLKSLQILSGKNNGQNIITNGILAESPFTVLTEPPTWKKIPKQNKNYSQVSANLLSMSPFNVKEKNSLSNQEEEILISWLQDEAKSWSMDLIKDEEFLNDLEYALNSEKTGLYLNYLENLPIDKLIEKGQEYHNAGEYRNSISYYDRALLQSIDSGQTNIDLLILKGSAYNGLNEYEKALIYFDDVLDIEPENSEALRKKAFTLAQLGQIDDAKHYFNLSQKN